MSSLYPAQIDNTSSLPVVSDNITAVAGATVNRLREVIIRIESELGVKPSGLYGTVRARLDALEAIVSEGGGGGGSVIFAGDLSGTSTIQAVVGLQNRPLADTAPTSGQAILWTGTVWAPESITQDIILPGFTISLSGGGLTEVGQTVATPAFTASYNRTAATAVLTDSEGNTKNVISSPTAFTSNGTFTKNTFGAAVVFTLTASDAINTAVVKTSTAGLTWAQKSYYGVAIAGQTGASFIQSLTGFLAVSRGTSFAVSAGSTQKVYFACRTAYGAATFTVGGFSGGFSLTSNTISVTNAHGFTENYQLYESDNLNLGSITVSVS